MKTPSCTPRRQTGPRSWGLRLPGALLLLLLLPLLLLLLLLPLLDCHANQDPRPAGPLELWLMMLMMMMMMMMMGGQPLARVRVVRVQMP